MGWFNADVHAIFILNKHPIYFLLTTICKYGPLSASLLAFGGLLYSFQTHKGYRVITMLCISLTRPKAVSVYQSIFLLIQTSMYLKRKQAVHVIKVLVSIEVTVIACSNPHTHTHTHTVHRITAQHLARSRKRCKSVLAPLTPR